MLPGPLTAVTIAKGYHNQNAGSLIAVGHAVIELPLMALVYFGFSQFFASPDAKRIIGLVGGLVLISMGALVFRGIRKSAGKVADLPYNSLTAGIIMTGTNPYFFLWWATIGITLIAGAAVFGVLGLALFAVVHLACDLVWEQVVSMSVFRTRHLWTPKVQKIVFGVCALVLVAFGVYFCVSVFV